MFEKRCKNLCGNVFKPLVDRIHYFKTLPVIRILRLSPAKIAAEPFVAGRLYCIR
jgi:hypothetical protein